VNRSFKPRPPAPMSVGRFVRGVRRRVAKRHGTG